MPSLDLKLTTDANGDIKDKTLFDPLGWLHLDVTLTATLLPPEGAEPKVLLDIVAVTEGTDSEPKSFTISGASEVNLGDWKIDAGDNVVVLRGRSEPAIAGVVVMVHVETRASEPAPTA